MAARLVGRLAGPARARYRYLACLRAPGGSIGLTAALESDNNNNNNNNNTNTNTNTSNITTATDRQRLQQQEPAKDSPAASCLDRHRVSVGPTPERADFAADNNRELQVAAGT